MAALQLNNYLVLKELIASRRFNIDQEYRGNCGLLVWSIREGSKELVSFFLDAGANVNLISTMESGTQMVPLNWAIEGFNKGPAREEILKILLDRGADPSIRTNPNILIKKLASADETITPFMHALCDKKYLALNIMIEKKGLTHERDSDFIEMFKKLKGLDSFFKYVNPFIQDHDKSKESIARPSASAFAKSSGAVKPYGPMVEKDGK